MCFFLSENLNVVEYVKKCLHCWCSSESFVPGRCINLSFLLLKIVSGKVHRVQEEIRIIGAIRKEDVMKTD
jgi:hypothetical protein